MEHPVTLSLTVASPPAAQRWRNKRTTPCVIRRVVTARRELLKLPYPSKAPTASRHPKPAHPYLCPIPYYIFIPIALLESIVSVYLPFSFLDRLLASSIFLLDMTYLVFSSALTTLLRPLYYIASTRINIITTTSVIHCVVGGLGRDWLMAEVFANNKARQSQ